MLSKMLDTGLTTHQQKYTKSMKHISEYQIGHSLTGLVDRLIEEASTILFKRQSSIQFFTVQIAIYYQLKRCVNVWAHKQEGRQLQKRLTSDINTGLKNASHLPCHIQIMARYLFEDTITNQELRGLYQIFQDRQSFNLYRQLPQIWEILETIDKANQKFKAHGNTNEQNILPAVVFEQVQYKRNSFEIDLKQVLQSQQVQRRQKTEQMIERLKELQAKFVPKKLKIQKGQLIGAKLRIRATVKTLMWLQLNANTIQFIDQCQAYQCKFMLFLIPLGLLLAETLAFYDPKTVKNMTLHYLFQKIILKINTIKNSTNPQLPQNQIMEHLIDMLKFDRLEPIHLNSKFQKFIETHQEKMSTFMPVYLSFFSFHAFQKRKLVEQLQHEPIPVKRARLAATLKELEESFQKFNIEGK